MPSQVLKPHNREASLYRQIDTRLLSKNWVYLWTAKTKSSQYPLPGSFFYTYEPKRLKNKFIQKRHYGNLPTLETGEIKPSIPAFLRKRIQQLETLKNGWDSYFAKPIDSRVIQMTVSLLNQIQSILGSKIVEKVFIAPCSDGGIQLEWAVDSREVIIKLRTSDRSILFLKILPSGKEQEGVIRSEADLIKLFK